MALPPVADETHIKWMNGRCSDTSLPMPAPSTSSGEADDIANDNAQRCRRSGVAIDPMFLN